MIASGEVLQKRYRIDGKIGQGGMGAVYVATDERFGSVVAIKETLCMDGSFRKAIEREARLLNSLRHLALPRVTDHFEENDSQYLVMEFIPGEDLGHILEDTQQPFPVDQVVNWADQLLDALDFLHNQEIPVIHRDIKPQNLKTTLEGQIILLDFGLAKGNPTDAGRQTAAKSIFGYSRNYASLEQIQGTGTDPRSDLYSLSATLYHLLTGHPPEDALTRAMAVLGGSPDPLISANLIREEIPKGLSGVLMSAMDLNAAGRPANAKEMRQMLRESENYAYLADARPAPTTTSSVGAADPETQAVKSATFAGREVGAEAKTEIMPVYDSRETALRAPAPIATTAARTGKGWSRGLAALTAGLLLVGVAVGTGYYIYWDKIGLTPSNPVEVVEPSGVPAANPNASAASTETETVSPVANVATAETDRSGTAGTSSKSAVGAKNSKQPQSDTRPPNETINIQAPPDEDIPGDVVITKKNPDGSTTTTRILKGKPDSPNLRSSPANRDRQFPNEIDMQYLTPAQRRRIRELMRANGTVPVPPSSPQQKP